MKSLARKKTIHNRLTSGELLSNDRLASSIASYGLLRLALAELKGCEESTMRVCTGGIAVVNGGAVKLILGDQ